jgi:hypothetical protein
MFISSSTIFIHNFHHRVTATKLVISDEASPIVSEPWLMGALGCDFCDF